MTAPGNGRRILIVDDEEALVKRLALHLGRIRTNDTIETAHDGEMGLAAVREEHIDLLVVDVRMPRMSGVDLALAARRLHPGLPVIFISGYTADITSFDGGPFTKVLEKPFPMQRLHELVDEAFAPAVGFSGAISVQTLPDIVQMYALSSATGLLSVRHVTGEGKLFFSGGFIQHAVAPNALGEEAFYEIMTWSGGEFSMRLGHTSAEHTIRANWQELVIESVRRLDELRRTSAPPKSASTGWTLAPPSPPVEPESKEPEDIFFVLEAPTRTAHTEVTAASTLEQRNEPDKEILMNIKDSLAKLNQIDGFVGAALVDSESGMLLGSEGGGGMNLEVAAAGNTEVVKSKRKTMQNLGLKEGIEDILITLTKQYHLIRPLRARTSLFFYVALDRNRANLAMARIALADVEKELQV